MTKTQIKKITKIIYWITLITLISTGSIIALIGKNIPKGYKLYTVQSGSMEPSIRVGSIVLIKAEEKYNQGDIITYKSESDRNNPKPQITTTHRIVSLEEKDEGVFYKTKGDANNSADASLIDKDLVLGKVIFSLPFAGYVASFSQTPLGLITLVVIPATLIVYNEFINIKNEIKKILTEREKRKLASEAKENIDRLFTKLETKTR